MANPRVNNSPKRVSGSGTLAILVSLILSTNKAELIVLSRLTGKLDWIFAKVYIAFPVHKRYIFNPEKLNQQKLNCTSQMREAL